MVTVRVGEDHLADTIQAFRRGRTCEVNLQDAVYECRRTAAVFSRAGQLARQPVVRARTDIINSHCVPPARRTACHFSLFYTMRRRFATHNAAKKPAGENPAGVYIPLRVYSYGVDLNSNVCLCPCVPVRLRR